MPLHKNQLLDLNVDSYGMDAQGVCRAEGMPVFVSGALEGERVRVCVVKVERRYAFGRVEAVLTPSPARCEPPCPIYRRCGGCAAQHMAYEETLLYKRRQVQDCLTRIGGLDVQVPPVLGMDDPWHYRNKGAFPVGGHAGAPRIGFYAPRSHDLIDLPPTGCAIQREEANACVRAVREWMRQSGAAPYDEAAHSGLVRHVMARVSQSGEVLFVLVVNGERVPLPELLVALLRRAVPTLTGAMLSVNTARTNVFEGEFASALKKADRAYVGKLSNAGKIPPSRRMDTSALAALSGVHCRAFDDNMELLNALKADVAADESAKVVVFFSNGNFDSIHRIFAREISS